MSKRGKDVKGGRSFFTKNPVGKDFDIERPHAIRTYFKRSHPIEAQSITWEYLNVSKLWKIHIPYVEKKTV